MSFSCWPCSNAAHLEENPYPYVSPHGSFNPSATPLPSGSRLPPCRASWVFAGPVPALECLLLPLCRTLSLAQPLASLQPMLRCHHHRKLCKMPTPHRAVHHPTPSLLTLLPSCFSPHPPALHLLRHSFAIGLPARTQLPRAGISLTGLALVLRMSAGHSRGSGHWRDHEPPSQPPTHSAMTQPHCCRLCGSLNPLLPQLQLS